MQELFGAVLLAGIVWLARRVRLRLRCRCPLRGRARWEIDLEYDPSGFHSLPRSVNQATDDHS